MSISELHPVQIVIDGEIKSIPIFDSWEIEGISSMAYHFKDPKVIYIDRGNALVKIDLHRRESNFLNIENLKDVHEITMIDNTLWIANTGFNEAVAFNIIKERVEDRIDLFTLDFFSKQKTTKNNKEMESIDKFHLNQVFLGIDNNLYGLVHHTYGKQLIKHVEHKKIKLQGDGGVINMSNNKPIPLNLKSPHTVRIVQNSYWVCDSGNFTINIYSPDWKLKNKIKTNGYGRGADFSKKLGFFYVGISELRKRYIKLLKLQVGKNMVQIFSINKKELIEEIILNSIEQVNNLYLVDRKVGMDLLEL